MTFDAGEQVEVTPFSGTVVRSRGVSSEGEIIRVQEKGTGRTLDVPAKLLQRKAPESWPPQVGDIWVTNLGEEYFCRKVKTGIFNHILSPASHDAPAFDNDDAFAEFLRMRPTLVRRRGQ